MVWMVHRVWLNDPTLTELDFSNLQMPQPTVDIKVAPKLCKGIGHNKYLERMYIPNSGLYSGEAEVLAESLKLNKGLKELNIEGNFVDTTALCMMAEALGESGELRWYNCVMHDGGGVRWVKV